MKPAIFHLANLNLTVTISPDARRWVQEHIVSLETYAWAQADVFKRGGDVDKGVHVEFIEKPHECRTVADLKGAKREQPPAPVSPTDYCVHCNASLVGRTRVGAGNSGGQIYACLDCHRKRNPPADTYHTKKTEKIVRGEEFEPVGTMPVVGDRVRMGWGEVVTVDKYDAGLLSWYGKAHSDGSPCGFVRDAIEHGDVRILKRERGTELLGARVWAWVGSCTYAEVEINGRCYFEASDNKGKWARDHAPLHRHDPEQRCTELSPDEAKPYLADPALLALVGG